MQPGGRRRGTGASPEPRACPPRAAPRARLALCIVNHDGERHLARTLPAAAQRLAAFDEVLVADGGSTDRGLEIVAERLPSARIVRLRGNPGPGAARNAALRATDAELVLFADNDVQLCGGVPERLVEALERRAAGAVAVPRVLHAADPDVVQYEGADTHFLGLMALRHAERRAGELPTAPVAIGSLVTACFLLDRRRWGRDDPFDESFVFNLEDHDFGLRCRLRGLEIVAVPDASVLHGAGTPGLSLRRGGRPAALRVYCLIRNRWLILWKAYAGRTLVVLAPALALYELAQLAGAARRGWLREWAQAAAWVIGHVPELARQRRLVQRTRRVSDRELLSGGPLPFTADLPQGRLERAAVGGVEALTGLWWRLARRLL